MKLHLKYILIMTLNLVFLSNFILSNYIMKIYSNNSVFVFILVSLFSLILLLFLPNSFKHIIKSFLSCKLIKIIISIYIIISTLLISYVLFNILSIRFFFVTPTFLLIIIFSYFLILGLIPKLSTIINTTFIISIILLVLALIPFINFNSRDFRLLLRLDFFNINNFSFIFLLCFIFDNFLFLFIPEKQNNKINKYDIIISTVIGVIISLWFIIDNYTFLDYSFFKDMNFPSLYRYKLYYGPKYIEHFDNFLNIFLCCYLYLKCLINGKLLRVTLKIKNNFIFSLMYSIILCVINIFIYYTYLFKIDYIYIPCIILFISISCIYIFLFRRSNYESNIT